MDKQRKWFEFIVSILKQLLKLGFIFTWSYSVVLNVYNSTLMNIYSELFLDGVSSNIALPAEIIRSLPRLLETIISILVVGYIILCVVEYILQKNIKEALKSIVGLGLIAICIKIPQYIMIGFFYGNEYFIRQIIIYIIIGIVIIFGIKYFNKKHSMST